MGLLDTSSRWMDVMLTSVGRRALAEGDLDVQYYSFSDRSAGYILGGEIGEVRWLDDPHKHLMTEAFSKPQDQVILTTDLFGDVVRDEDFVISNEEGEQTFSLSGGVAEQPWDAEFFGSFVQSLSSDLKSNSSLSLGEINGDLHFRPKDGVKHEATIPRRLWDVDAKFRFRQMSPIQDDEEFSGLSQMEFLPPVVFESDIERDLGSWARIFPEPIIVQKSVLDAGKRQGRRCLNVEFNDATATFQFFVLQDNVLTTLSVVETKTNEETLKSWVVGELVDVEGETHFIRLFRVFWDQTKDEETPKQRLLED